MRPFCRRKHKRYNISTKSRFRVNIENRHGLLFDISDAGLAAIFQPEPNPPRNGDRIDGELQVSPTSTIEFSGTVRRALEFTGNKLLVGIECDRELEIPPQIQALIASRNSPETGLGKL